MIICGSIQDMLFYGRAIQSALEINWLSVCATTGDKSFLGTSSSFLLFVVIIVVAVLVISTLSAVPFCITFTLVVDEDLVVVAPDECPDATFDVTFFTGECAAVVLVDFWLDKRFVVEVMVLALRIVVADIEERVVVLDIGELVVRAIEICLLAVSLICLSIIGDFAREVRVFAVLLLVVVALDFVAFNELLAAFVPADLAGDLAAVIAEVGLDLPVVDNAVVVVAVVVLDDVREPVVVLLVLVLAAVDVDVIVDLVAAFVTVVLLRDLTSPLRIDFFSTVLVVVLLAEADAGFDFVRALLGRAAVFVVDVAVVDVLLADTVFVALDFAVLVEV